MADDTLALPAVPPQAPDDHRVRDFAIVALFAAALLGPLAGVLVRPERGPMPFENRQAHPWPAWRDPSTARERTAALERAFADRFGGRDRLIALHHYAHAVVFGRSPVPKVLIGRDGWLYFTGEDSRAVERFHRGVPEVPDAQVRALVDEYARRAALLERNGIAYVAVIVPDKAAIYPEHLPPWIVRAPATPLDRVADALRRDGRVRFVDLRGPLLAAKARERVYHQTDSHWNLAGAAVGYAEVLAAARAAMPRFDGALRPTAVLPPPVALAGGGDLTAMLGLPSRFPERDARPLSALLDDPRRCAKRIDAHLATPGRQVHACDRPGLPRLFMLHDSMAIPLIPLLSEHFGRALYLARRDLDPALVAAERPDLVIDEVVERLMFIALETPVR